MHLYNHTLSHFLQEKKHILCFLIFKNYSKKLALNT